MWFHLWNTLTELLSELKRGFDERRRDKKKEKTDKRDKDGDTESKNRHSV